MMTSMGHGMDDVEATIKSTRPNVEHIKAVMEEVTDWINKDSKKRQRDE